MLFRSALYVVFSVRCPVLSLTGVRCPTCGVTSALAALLQGDVEASFALNPFAVPLVASVAFVPMAHRANGKVLWAAVLAAPAASFLMFLVRLMTALISWAFG